MKNTESGRNMVEMLGVLAIIGMLSVGGIWGFSEAIERHKLNKSKAQLSAILNSVAAHLYDNRQKTEEDISLIPYFKYKTPALFDDMPIVKGENPPYEFLQDAMGAYVSIFIRKKPLNYETAVNITGTSDALSGIDFMKADTGVVYCRNVFSIAQQVARDNPEKFLLVVFYDHWDYFDFTFKNIANMSVGQMTTFCYDKVIASRGKFFFKILFNNRIEN